MMKKILIITCVIVAGVFFLVGKWGGDSKLFAQTLPSNMNEAHEIKEITIYEVKPTGKPKAISLTEKEDIAKILKAGEAMELNETNDFVSSGYLLLFQGSKENYALTVNEEGNIDMNGHEEHYDIKGKNALFQAIQGMDNQWELLKEGEL
ncbi:hypothetical protein ACW0TQ_08555 [Oceanobacillus sp. M60]|uniref:Uncharacterized protein n=2 Tax=Oceanobacillus TaxID=182709 RepID=A0A0A1MHT0_9BACI|nr:hypothetical protein [Oceanobacillus oncorhynchi]CEI82648.1 hypothetical protein BN997_02531 [Oceanobacillus oncorhynchi]